MSTHAIFWSVSLILVLATLAALLVPLLRSRPQHARPADDAAAAAVYRDQKHQLDRDFAAGAISAAERDTTNAELVERLGGELDPAPAAAVASSSRAPWVAAILLVLAVPIVALVAYFTVGNPQALDASLPRQRMADTEIVAMVERLAQKMKENPSDPKGWLLLGRSWTALQRYQASADAYAQAAKLLPGNADALADWADALAMAQGRKLAGRPTEIIDQALAADPVHAKALALAASAAMERRDDKSALRHWRALLAVLPPGSEDAESIQATIAQLEGGGAAPASSADARRESVARSASSPAGAATLDASRIAGRVEVAPALASRISPDATLFVYARASQGPRVPLAVMRRTARELPLAFTLDDSMSMAPGATLSGAREVIVEARISASGNATPSPGDLAGQSGPVAPGITGLRITIDRVLP